MKGISVLDYLSNRSHHQHVEQPYTNQKTRMNTLFCILMNLPTAYLTQDPSAPLIFLLQISAIYAGPAAPPAAQAPVIPLPRLC